MLDKLKDEILLRIQMYMKLGEDKSYREYLNKRETTNVVAEELFSIYEFLKELE